MSLTTRSMVIMLSIKMYIYIVRPPMKSLRRYKEKKYIESTAVNVTFEVTLRESVVTL